jgi:hypothetical protein
LSTSEIEVHPAEIISGGPQKTLRPPGRSFSQILELGFIRQQLHDTKHIACNMSAPIKTVPSFLRLSSFKQCHSFLDHIFNLICQQSIRQEYKISIQWIFNIHYLQSRLSQEKRHYVAGIVKHPDSYSP